MVALNDYFDTSVRYDIYNYYGPSGRISNTYHRLRNGTIERFPEGQEPLSVLDVQERLKCVDHMKVYPKTDLPIRHHYMNNQRIDNIILDPQINWTVSRLVHKKSVVSNTM